MKSRAKTPHPTHQHLCDNTNSHVSCDEDRCSLTHAVDRAVLDRSLRGLTRAAADLASFCEHVEHNEKNSVDDALRAAACLREVAVELSSQSGMSLATAYAERIRAVEEGSLLRHTLPADCSASLLGADMLATATTWDKVQIGQLVHDRQFHPDVFGLSKIDQVRHYTYHVTKLAGLLADAIDQGSWEAFRSERLADVAVFGVKLATVCNSELPSEPVDADR